MGEARTFIRDVEIHPAAGMFPEMQREDLDKLCDSITRNGVRVPLVFFDGKLLDGRNRMRACVMAGIPTEKIPRRTVSDVDPFLWAWDANCSRLDYSPAQKAAIRIKIEEASGDLARMKAEIEEKANRARAEKQAGVPKEEASERRASREAARSPPPPPKRASAEIAEKAHVSRATVERVQKLKREDPAAFDVLATKGRLPPGHPLNANRKPAKNWSVPRSIPALASFLRERLTSHERRDLARLLMEGDEAAA